MAQERKWNPARAGPKRGEDEREERILSDRQGMQHALQEVEERYRALFRSIDEGVCVLEVVFDRERTEGPAADLRFLEVNRAFERKTGLRHVLGKRVREVLPDLDEWWFRICGEVARTGHALRSENQAPGLQLWFDVYAFRVGPPEAHRVALVLDNVTERKRRELSAQFHAELQNLFERVTTPREILDAAAERIAAHLDVDAVVFSEVTSQGATDPGGALRKVADAREERLTARTLSSFPPPAPGAPTRPRTRHALRGTSLVTLSAGQLVAIDDVRGVGGGGPLAGRNHRRGGAEVHVPELKEGRLRYVLSVSSDEPRHWRPYELDLLREVSARVWLRLERARAEQALRRSESRVRLALGAAEMGLWTWHPREGVLSCDERAARILGLDAPGETSLGWLLEHRIHPGDVAAVKKALSWARASEASWGIAGRSPFEFRVRPAPGEERWVLGSAARSEVVGDEDSPETLVGIVMDVTERRRVEEVLRETDRRKDEFLATLAHELRNPLAPLEHGLEILKMSSGLRPGFERVQEIMARQVGHMCRLVDDLLEVSRITRGTIELRKERLELGRVIHTALEMTDSLLERAEHKLTLSLPGEVLVVEGDAVRLAQVFANLLNNAAKYTDPPGEIGVRAWREDRAVCVSVRDNGVGVGPDLLPRIFDLFAQADRTSRKGQGGLGIGLTLVRSLVELHGGTVEARSEGLGRGSEFIVRLPLAVERRREPRHSDRSTATLSSACRVLVVDDNRDAAESLGTLLEMIGAEVRVEHDGPHALAALGTFHPTAVLLDLGMPGMDGFEVAQRIQRHPSGQGVTLIAMTGWGQEEDRRRTRQAGFDHHLVKPADLGQLQQLLGGLS